MCLFIPRSVQFIFICLRPQVARSRQGKVEKSLLNFAATYPGWTPDAATSHLLDSINPAAGLPGPGVGISGPPPAWGTPGGEYGQPPTASSVLGAPVFWMLAEGLITVRRVPYGASMRKLGRPIVCWLCYIIMLAGVKTSRAFVLCPQV